MSKTKMTKDTIPEGFTLSLALADGLPVLFFSLAFILLGNILNNILFTIGAILVFLAGAAKVLWKVIVALWKKNIWFLFIQMRIIMPLGMVLMLTSLFVLPCAISLKDYLTLLISSKAWICHLLCAVAMTMMAVFAFKLDGGNVRNNWIEQLTNVFAQLMFLIGVILIKRAL